MRLSKLRICGAGGLLLGLMIAVILILWPAAPARAQSSCNGVPATIIGMAPGLITGTNGLAVDGDLLAQRLEDGTYRVEFPTGDNSPGGLFESWFAVRTHSRGTGTT